MHALTKVLFSEAFDKVAKIFVSGIYEDFYHKGKKRKERKIKFRYINLNIKQGDIKMKSKPPDYPSIRNKLEFY